MKKLLLLVSFLFIAAKGWSAITVDSETVHYDSSSTNPITWSMTVGGTANFLMVACGIDGASRTISGVTWNGVSMTALGRTDGDGTNSVGVYYLVNPAQGSHTVSATLAAPGNNGYLGCGAVSLVGVNTATPIDSSTGTVTGGSATTAAVTWNTTKDGDMLLDYINVINNSTPSQGGSQALQFNFRNTNNGGNGSGSSLLAGAAGSQTMTWSISFTEAIMTAIAIEPALVGGSHSWR